MVLILLLLLKILIAWWWVFALDMLGLVIDTFVPGFSPPRWVFWAIPAVGFVVANVKLFAELESEKQSLQNRIAELEATEADIRLEVVDTVFAVSHPMTSPPFPEVKINGYSFDERGLPGWGTIWATLKVENIGREAGS